MCAVKAGFHASSGLSRDLSNGLVHVVAAFVYCEREYGNGKIGEAYIRETRRRS